MAFTITAKVLSMVVKCHDIDMLVREDKVNNSILFASILHGDNMLQKFILKKPSLVSMELEGKANIWQNKVIGEFINSLKGEQEVRVVSGEKLTIEVNNMLGLKVSEFSGAFVFDHKEIEKSVDNFKAKPEKLAKMCKFKMRFAEFGEFMSRIKSVASKGTVVLTVKGKKLGCSVDERTYTIDNVHYLEFVEKEGMVKMNTDYLNIFAGLKIDPNVECVFYMPINNDSPFFIEVNDALYDYSCAIAPRIDMT